MKEDRILRFAADTRCDDVILRQVLVAMMWFIAGERSDEVSYSELILEYLQVSVKSGLF